MRRDVEMLGLDENRRGDLAAYLSSIGDDVPSESPKFGPGIFNIAELTDEMVASNLLWEGTLSSGIFQGELAPRTVKELFRLWVRLIVAGFQSQDCVKFTSLTFGGRLREVANGKKFSPSYFFENVLSGSHCAEVLVAAVLVNVAFAKPKTSMPADLALSSTSVTAGRLLAPLLQAFKRRVGWQLYQSKFISLRDETAAKVVKFDFSQHFQTVEI